MSQTSKPKPIPMQEVKSSQVKAIGHDPLTNTLSVQFNTGGTYHYPDVSAEKFQELTKAKSIGSHVHQHFVKTKHKFTKLQ